MISCQMHWDGIIEHDNGTKEVRFGFRVMMAENKEDAIVRARDFFKHGSFIDYDALLEGEDFIYEIELD